MAHFAKISEENEVLQVVVVDNKDTTNGKGVEEELVGQTYLEKHSNWPANLWIQTSYNSNFRKHYAGIGCIWHPDHDFFTGPKPFPSWTLNTTDAKWDAPVAKPDLTAEQILIRSGNIGSVRIGQKVGIEKLKLFLETPSFKNLLLCSFVLKSLLINVGLIS